MQGRNTALLSIKPIYADSILDGAKRFEFRKVGLKEDVEFILIYASSPVREFVGLAEVEKIIKGSPKALWKLAGDLGGITKEDYNEYFRGKRYGYAIKIKEIYRFENPIAPKKVFRKFHPPQSFMYISRNKVEGVLKAIGDEISLCWWHSRCRQDDILSACC